MAKKIFFFSLSLFILALIFLGAYNLAFKNNVNNPIADPSKKSFDQEKEGVSFITEGMAESPINESILGATVSEDALFYYSLDDKSLKKSSLEGKNKTVLMSNLPGEVTRILWSSNKNEALLLLKQTTDTVWYFAELNNKTLVPLKPEIGRLAWDNLGEKIFYQYTDPTTQRRSLNIANPDGSNWKKLTDLGSDDFFLSAVPKSSLVSFWGRPSAEKATSLDTVGISGEGHHVFVSALYGADHLWAPTGERVLTSGNEAASGKEFSLRVTGTDGTTKNLAIPTLISKTTWSKDGHTIYYALPGSLPEAAVFPNDYFEKSLHSKDTFWKIDLNTGKKTRLVELKETTQVFDSTDFFLSPKEDALYFTDRVTKRLYRIEL